MVSHRLDVKNADNVIKTVAAIINACLVEDFISAHSPLYDGSLLLEDDVDSAVEVPLHVGLKDQRVHR